jgi:predicted AAA+ superfamily ATPase
MNILSNFTYTSTESFTLYYLSVVYNEGLTHQKLKSFQSIDHNKVKIKLNEICEGSFICSIVAEKSGGFFFKKDDSYYVINLTSSELTIRQFSASYSSSDEYFNFLAENLNLKPEKENDKFTITFTSFNTDRGYVVYNTKQLVGSKLDNVLDNYNSVVKSFVSEIRNINKMKKNGKLIILNGKPGTGKTHLLRALLREWNKEVQSYYITDPENLLKNSEYLNQILTAGSKSIIIMEDCDFFISKQSKTEYTQSASRLLNTLDGILGQGSDFLFILTANEDIKNVHEAFSRKGRCLANIPFDGLNYEEAKAWCEKHNVNIDNVQKNRDFVGLNKTSLNSYYSLAELYDHIPPGYYTEFEDTNDIIEHDALELVYAEHKHS